jgi:hypothetical protein
MHHVTSNKCKRITVVDQGLSRIDSNQADHLHVAVAIFCSQIRTGLA